MPTIKIRDLLVTTAFLSAPAFAGTFTPPEGCTAWLTLQSLSCEVSTFYRCEHDIPGDQWSIEFGVNGMSQRFRIDYETQWVETHDADGSIALLEPNPRDPASFSELLETGRDTYDFSLITNGVRMHFKGYDQLIGAPIEIDGITLTRTKYEIEASYDDGSLAWRGKGNQYIHAEWRRFIAGTGQTYVGDEVIPMDFSPVDFIFPGEPGFMSTTPIYDCDARTAFLPHNNQSEEVQNEL